MIKLTNNAIGRLAASVSVGDTTLTLALDHGAKFPALASGDWFPVTVVKSSGEFEIMRCTAKTSDTLTVTRAQEGTTAKTFDVDDRVELRMTAGAFQQVLAEYQAIADLAQDFMAPLAGNAGKILICREDEEGTEWRTFNPIFTPDPVSPAIDTVIGWSTTFVVSSYYSLFAAAQKALQIQVSASPAFGTIAWDSGAVLGSANTINDLNFYGMLSVNTTYYWRARYQDSEDRWSQWSGAGIIKTPVQFIPPAVGTAYGGGYYAGNIMMPDGEHMLIVAPKSAEANLAAKTNGTATTGAGSVIDGLANSNVMNNSTHPAAQYCRSYNGGGFTDWFLPARDQLLACRNTLYHATTTAPLFKTGGSQAFHSKLESSEGPRGNYRTSTYSATGTTTGFVCVPFYGTSIAFVSGYLDDWWVRPVRSEKIIA